MNYSDVGVVQDNYSYVIYRKIATLSVKLEYYFCSTQFDTPEGYSV